MEVGVWFCLNHSELHCPIWASLGPWEGPEEMQFLTMPKISGDCGMALSFPETPSTIHTLFP